MTDTTDFTALWPVAETLADAAAAETLAWFRRPALTADSKDAQAFDPVTEADRAAERAIRATLARLRPDDAILGEEEAATPGTTGLTWVIDPIDGTRGYLSGTPTWGTLIALTDATGPRLGIIDQPYTGERFMGGAGRAVMTGPRGDVALAARTTDRLDDAILFTTFPEIGTPDDRAAFARVADRVRLVRYGLDCYAYALVAAGQVDLVIEAGLQAYDVCASIAVIEAAGGVMTNWEGGPVHEGGRALAAANRQIHAQAMAAMAG